MKIRYAVLMLLTASLGFAGSISFSQTTLASSGSIAPGQTWTSTVAADTGVDFIWAIPGFQSGGQGWAGSVGMIGMSFTVTGSNFTFGGFDQTATPSCASGTGLVLCDINDVSTPWASQVSGSTVTFTAPSGDVVVPGELFLVAIPMVIVTTSTLPASDSIVGQVQADQVTFTGNWTTVSAVPEPGSLALLGTGLAGLVFAVRKRLLTQ